jgi:hypothetical protein
MTPAGPIYGTGICPACGEREPIGVDRIVRWHRDRTGRECLGSDVMRCVPGTVRRYRWAL